MADLTHSNLADVKLKTSFKWVFICLFTIVIINFGLFLTTEYNSEQYEERVIHSHEIINQSQLLLGTIKDAETGQRGYLLTLNDSYLMPYNEAVDRTNLYFVDLQAKVANSSQQQTRLKSLKINIESKLAELVQTIELAKVGQIEKALAIVNSDVGFLLMRTIRQDFNDFIAEEYRLLEVRRKEHDSSLRTGFIVLLTETLLSLLFLMALRKQTRQQFLTPLVNITRFLRQSNLGTNSTLQIESKIKEIARLATSINALLERNQRKHNEVIASEALLNEAQALASLGNWEWDIVTGELTWSAEVFRIFGMDSTSEAPTYEKFLTVIHADDREAVINAVNTAVADPNYQYGINHRIQLPDGTLKHVYEKGRVDRDEHGTAIRMIGTVQDVTEIIHLENELRQTLKALSKSNKAKDLFLANMSHELRTPLNGILGSVQLIHDDESLSNKTKNKLELITRSANYLTVILNDVLDISRRETQGIALMSAPFDIRELIDDIHSHFSPVAEAKNLLLKINKTIESNHYIGDQNRLMQVLFNLVDNAIKFTDKGQVELIVEQNPSINSINISVIDTGIGISAEDRERLFEAFEKGDMSTTREHAGIGIGLSIVKLIVDEMGGEIKVTSHLGQGTSILLQLPLEAQVQYEIKTPIADSDEKIAANILVAEDVKTNQIIIKSMLKKMGAEVTIVENGQLAVEQISDEFDLIFMDIHMPVMDGVEACKLIKQKYPNLPIAALTANVLPDDIKTYQETGFDEVIAKPYEKSAIRAFIQSSIS